MPASPVLNSEGVVKVHVTAAGADVPPTVQFISLTIHRAVNSVPWARLVVLDGDITDGSFDVADSARFAPGAEIGISLGYGADETSVFKGVVMQLGLRITGDNDVRLIIDCRDKAAKMTIGRHSTNHVDKTDSAVMQTLIGNHGLTADVEATPETHGGLVQHYCSDWDFMLTRAEANGQLVVVSDGKVSVKAPDTSSEPALEVTYGVDLIEFHGDIDARTQLTAVKASSWDPKTQALIEATGAAPSLGLQGDLAGSTLAQVASPAEFLLCTTARQTQAVLKSWADAQRLKAELARVRGRMKFQGSALAQPGSTLQVARVGGRFNGKVFVSAVHHEVADGNWTTEVEFGLAPDWFIERPDVVAPATSGLLPGVHGLQIGVVKKLDADPDGERRIQVAVQALDGANASVWARLAGFHASNTFGAFFVPEIGDEVILAYLNNDPCNPVVLGSVYSSKRPAAYELTAENHTKAIVTRCKSKIEFDEDKKIITVTTPAKNQLVFSDDGKSILMKDQNDNKVELNPGGITLDSPKDIKITAKGTITLDAVGKISITSKADVAAEGLNVACTAQVGFTGKGSATAELSAAGQTTVKGAMVMIN
ncbi:MAG: type VI secretion system tip protein VgrG [Rubrivivax sp.]|nr:type VI secretion system tip protein VgrG [Rubrivivax sp.]